MILAIDVTKPLESAADKFSYGGQMLLIGMSVVFSVLLLLWGALELFHLVVSTIEKKRTKAPAPKPAAVPAVETTASDDDESELVAVMAAAIAAASEENPEGSFRVVSFRRI